MKGFIQERKDEPRVGLKERRSFPLALTGEAELQVFRGRRPPGQWAGDGGASTSAFLLALHFICR